jgi:hypothetical protein
VCETENYVPRPEAAPTIKPSLPATKTVKFAHVWGADGKHRGAVDTSRLCILKSLFGICRHARAEVHRFEDEMCGLVMRVHAHVQHGTVQLPAHRELRDRPLPGRKPRLMQHLERG